MKTFLRLLGVALIAVTTNNFVWFALTFWAYLTTKSVISTSVVAGTWLVSSILSANAFGAIVDHHKKKHALIGSSVATLILFLAGYLFYRLRPESAFSTVASVSFWVFVLILTGGVIAGSMYNIAMPTLVALLVAEDERDRANGLLGTVMGISFAITSVASGFSLAYGGMRFVLAVAILFTLAALVVLWVIRVPEQAVIHPTDEKPKRMDLAGTVRVVKSIPGLFALIFFATFNNFLGGVFAALMDAYGLSLISVQGWGLLWGVLSLGFILGGLYIAKKGLGNNPVCSLFRINLLTWTVCIFFAIQPSIVLLATGLFLWLFFVPFIEAIEQTIFQKVVPHERLGRVFGFAYSVEQAASPVMAFIIGPLAQLVFIPLMTTGPGARLIGGWFGVGPGRGLALVFILSGIIGLLVTLIAMRSRAYQLLAARYHEAGADTIE
ncbi:MAG: MFS transporter [Armatimonadota bacterium]